MFNKYILLIYPIPNPQSPIPNPQSPIPKKVGTKLIHLKFKINFINYIYK